jgi:NTE family protein
VIIGSKASEGNPPPDEFDLLGQIENIVMKPANYDILPGEGILLEMDIKKQSTLAFDNVDELVEIGYNTTIQQMDSIRKLVHDRRSDLDSVAQKRKAFLEKWPPLRFKDIDIRGLSEQQALYVEKSVRKTESVIAVDEIKMEYMKLANDPSLVYLYPRAIYDPSDSLFTFRLRLIPEATVEASFGLFFSTTGLAQTYLGFNYRSISEVSTRLKGSIQFGRLYDGVNLGLRFDYPLKIPVYFEGTFNYNGFDYNTSNTNFFFEDLKPSYIVENEINFRFDVGLPYSMNGIFKGGIGIGRNQEIYYMTRDFASNDTSDISNVNLISLYLASERNSLDNKQFSTEGSMRKVSLRLGYGSESYFPGSTTSQVINEKLDYLWFSAKLENEGYYPIKGAFSLGYHYLLQATFKPVQNTYYSTLIEAPVFQPNLVTKSLFMEGYRAHQFIAAGLMPVYRFNKQIHAKLEAYGFFPLQEILADENNDAYLGTYFDTMKSLFNASVSVITPAGPIGFHAGYVTEEEKPWMFQISFGYLLFNKRSNDD